MRCQNELTFIAQVVRDFAASLPPSAKHALEQSAQVAVNAIEADLNKPLAPEPEN